MLVSLCGSICPLHTKAWSYLWLRDYMPPNPSRLPRQLQTNRDRSCHMTYVQGGARVPRQVRLCCE